MSSKKKTATGDGGAAPAEVPLFLQKTYHMIDTCDPQICTWSPDGETFIVKNTALFEQTIIPQFFKHSKFASFVRQLNFYGFRKIRYADKVSLKIDVQAEREQAKFWRFKHESFKRGRQDLLIEIKRSASSSSNSINQGGGGAGVIAPTPNAVLSDGSAELFQAGLSSHDNNSSTTQQTPPPTQDVSLLNQEVNTLKVQMQSMFKNMDELTSLVKNLNVSPSSSSSSLPPSSLLAGGVHLYCGNKRKKMSTQAFSSAVPSSSSSSAVVNMGMDDYVMMSFPSDNMDVLEDAATDLMPDLTLSSSHQSSLAPSPVFSRSSSMSSDIVGRSVDGAGGDDFVDELFHAFATEGDGEVEEDVQQQPRPQQQKLETENPNKPDPQLMKRIEDSLSTIPKTMHEMVANRLIDAIAEGNSSSNSRSDVTTRTSSSNSSSNAAAATNKEHAQENAQSRPSSAAEAADNKTSIPLPLAIATLKTILADYGLKVEMCGSSSEDSMVHRRLSNKSLPLVPMHA